MNLLNLHLLQLKHQKWGLRSVYYYCCQICRGLFGYKMDDCFVAFSYCAGAAEHRSVRLQMKWHWSSNYFPCCSCVKDLSLVQNRHFLHLHLQIIGLQYLQQRFQVSVDFLNLKLVYHGDIHLFPSFHYSFDYSAYYELH